MKQNKIDELNMMVILQFAMTFYWIGIVREMELCIGPFVTKVGNGMVLLFYGQVTVAVSFSLPANSS
ncbi:13895_t:CDS:1 [Acaulospora morrowiae]|uniref:13895_t:CDS:1 n=1 Tax=Acaulospora morrowiae TaxID=94023 RepID=A0A9N9B8E7_9GLOM|nr:13895_t:CDS:1 [Acaulospora morrowiae]